MMAVWFDGLKDGSTWRGKGKTRSRTRDELEQTFSSCTLHLFMDRHCAVSKWGGLAAAGSEAGSPVSRMLRPTALSLFIRDPPAVKRRSRAQYLRPLRARASSVIHIPEQVDVRGVPKLP